jgi:hypothetical protein
MLPALKVKACCMAARALALTATLLLLLLLLQGSRVWASYLLTP